MSGTARAADQFKQVADGAAVECSVSAHELTRFALVDDQFASVSKISSGTPYNDFAVTNEPVRGDIYVSVPETYAARTISFFATTKKGFVYKVACRIEPIPAAQVFVTNPAIARNKAADWEGETPPETSAVRLIEAMANDRTIDSFAVRQASTAPVRAGELEVQLLAEYRGASLAGKVVRLSNRGAKSVTLKESDLAPRGTIAVAIQTALLAPGASTTAFVVGTSEEGGHD
ncbi:type-F conjugative transfer system secretin TraK [Novosphingobium piscinae]|uniref:Type-F conjugative transfer system secretin TraK n=1 Tax=Novosphingobium piscinae TaxID=1507448 RepID=A0A7X1FWE4_9SPHN|nr:type-F conjugative transfer system secretin TraK [Novosphingobium piscinae]MBC2668240.1 type-F conjugative transfer system secretin TraK [Novosphingobium piscinae]